MENVEVGQRLGPSGDPMPTPEPRTSEMRFEDLPPIVKKNSTSSDLVRAELVHGPDGEKPTYRLTYPHRTITWEHDGRIWRCNR